MQVDAFNECHTKKTLCNKMPIKNSNWHDIVWRYGNKTASSLNCTLHLTTADTLSSCGDIGLPFKLVSVFSASTIKTNIEIHYFL